MILYGAAREPVLAVVASIIAGISWIAVLANLNVAAQMALPEWVRARGLAVYVTVFFGAMTLGSLAWGEASHVCGLPIALYAAAVGMIIFSPHTRRWKLQGGTHVDLTPSMHRPTPVVSTPITGDSGPILVTTEYVIKENDRDLFLAAIGKLFQERGGDGAFDWGIFGDISRPGRFLETSRSIRGLSICADTIV